VALSFAMGQDEATIRSRLWRNGKAEAEDFPVERISEYLDDDSCLVWVDICDPDSEHLAALAKELALDPLAVEDAVTMGTDDEQDLSESRLSVSRVSAFVLRRGLMTVRRGDDFDMAPVIERWEDNADLLKYGPGALMHGLLDVIVDGHFDAVQALDDQIESLEDLLFDERAVSREVQRRTYRVRRDLVELRRIVLPMREVVNAVLRHRKDLDAPAELNSWYDDLYDHVLRATEWTESLRDMVTTVFETNLSLQDARLNTVMKKLTAWAAIIAVPTAITGYFGQNVPYPGFGKSWGFILSAVAILVIALGLYTMFKRRDWL